MNKAASLLKGKMLKKKMGGAGTAGGLAGLAGAGAAKGKAAGGDVTMSGAPALSMAAFKASGAAGGSAGKPKSSSLYSDGSGAGAK